LEQISDLEIILQRKKDIMTGVINLIFRSGDSTMMEEVEKLIV